MNKFTPLILLFVILFISCKPTNNSLTNSSGNKLALETDKLQENGFTKGTIVFSDKEGDCPFTIEVINSEGKLNYFDPINLEESFKQNGMIVWFTYAGLRRMNRCTKANPISIIEIKKE